MIDTKALRSKILDAAIRGLLTQQLPKDGTAEELYEQIQDEKEKLIQKGKLKKEKPLPEITEEEIPFEIPENWKWVRLDEICLLINGDRGKNYPAKSKLKNEGIPFISALNLNGISVTEDEHLLCLDEEQYQQLRAGKLQKDDIVICIRGSLGKHGRYPFDKGAIASSLVISRFFYSPKTLGDFEMIWLDSPVFFSEIKKYNNGTAQPNLAANNLKLFLFPLPPLSEQERIVEKIGQLFSVLDEIDALQAQYADNRKALKSKLIDAAIQGKLTEQLPEDGTAEELYEQIIEEKKQILLDRNGRQDKNLERIENDVPFDLPTTWKWIRFGEIGLFKKGPFGSALTKSIFVSKANDTIKVYEQQNAINKDHNLGRYYITQKYFEEKMNGFEVCPGDVIVSCAGTIGETYVMPEGMERGIINQALMRITLVPSVDTEFFRFFFDAYLKKSANDQSFGSAIKNIPPFDVLKNWYFPLPPLSEQERIVSTLNELLPLLE